MSKPQTNDVSTRLADFGPDYDVTFEAPSLEDYVRLKEQTGVIIHDQAAAARGLLNTGFAIQVRFRGSCIAFCRVISDGGIWYYMVDETVSPDHDHDRDHLRKFMVTWLVDHFHQTTPPGAYMLVRVNDLDFYGACGLTPIELPEEGLYVVQPEPKAGEKAMVDQFPKPNDDLGLGYEVIYEMVDAETFLRFREIGDLGAKDPASVPKSIAKTWFAVQVRYQGECIAFCRLLGDDGFWHFMSDGIVLPEHQAAGIGKFFVSRLIYHFYETAAVGAHLLAFTRAPDFGVKSGFNRLPKGEVGMYAWQPISRNEG